MASGRPNLDTTLDGNLSALAAFKPLCARVFEQSQLPLSEALEIQRKRKKEAAS